MKYFISTIILSLTVAYLFGQATVGAFGEIIVSRAAPIPEVNTYSKENVVNGAANPTDKIKGELDKDKLSDGEYRYMSYKVLILSSVSPLQLNHHIFSSYKEITFHQSREKGFSYFHGDYSDEKEAAVILEKIQRVYPNASIVKERRYIKANK